MTSSSAAAAPSYSTTSSTELGKPAVWIISRRHWLRSASSRTRIEAPLDLFMSTTVAPDGSLTIQQSPSEPGDYVLLRAEIDLVVGLAACADDVTPCNGGFCGPLVVDIVPPDSRGQRGDP